MFTKWEQVEEWIRDNNFAHWVFYRTNPNESTEKINNIIADSNFYTGGDEDKIAMTRKYLIANGGKAYGVGFRTPNTTQGGIVCEVRLEQDTPQAQPTAGVGAQGYDMESLRESIMKEVRAEYERKEYERKRSELDRERKEFEEQKNSAIGLLTNYLAPVAQALMAGRGARVAGVDTQEPVAAQPIIPIEQQEQQQTEDMAQQQEIFTEQEADKLFELMARFKQAEPDFMQMIEKVVAMAENGDATYKMAKSVLIK